jgi:16S rRNA (guanine966-N2)-methyltransferase
MARKQKRFHVAADDEGAAARETPVVRIIGGTMRGRKLLYSGDPRTRPMKDRVREAVFNLLGPGVTGLHVIDLFAGTGALGLEALSRGAADATFIEQHYPTAAIIRQNAALVGATPRSEVISANTFIWVQRDLSPKNAPWLVFCSPPYAFYVERQAEMLSLVETLLKQAPAGSIIVVESDERFDRGLLPDAGKWDTRQYPPAFVSIWRN